MSKRVKIIANASVENKNNKKENLISIGKVYEIYSEIITEKMFSGKCYIIKANDGTFHGLDSDYFDII